MNASRSLLMVTCMYFKQNARAPGLALAVQRRSQVEDAPAALLARPDRLVEGSVRARPVGERLNNSRAPSRIEAADRVSLRRTCERNDGEHLAFNEERRALEILRLPGYGTRWQRDFVR